MNQEYKISKKLLWKYLLKKAIYDTFFMLIPLSILLILIILGTNVSTGILIVTKISWGIILFLVGLFFYSLISINAPSALIFGIENNRFTKSFSSSKLNFFNKLTFDKMQRRTGQKQFNFIYFDDVKSIKIGKNNIKIKSVHDNIFNANGKIIVPNEIENFDLFKETISNHSATKNRIKNN